MNGTTKEFLKNLPSDKWHHLLTKYSHSMNNQEVYRSSSDIGGSGKIFALVIQRKIIKGRDDIDLNTDGTGFT